MGEISLEAESISITDSSQLQAGFFSGGEGGRIVLDANDLITINRSRLFADVEAGAVGEGSEIEMLARSVSILDSLLKS